jgi:SAM-dependent methyltransferase
VQVFRRELLQRNRVSRGKSTVVLLDRILGIPWVYDHVRPFVMGNPDPTPVFEMLGDCANDVLLDIGCGTGVALNYLERFGSYHGFDPDSSAVAAASRKHASSNIHFYARAVVAEDLASIRPTKALLMNLLHHLNDEGVLDLLRMLHAAPSITQVVTADPVYAPGRPIGNTLARLDRGKFVRTVDGMKQLLSQVPMEVRSSLVASPGRGWQTGFAADLRPRRD